MATMTSESPVKLPALQILKAAPQHAEELGSSALAMLLAICAHWDYLGCSRAVCWSNSRLAERCGLSRNSVAKVRQRLIDGGWICYLPDGRNAGHYTPKLPEWYAQSSAVECANGVQLSVQTLCKHCAIKCATTVQMRVTYIPTPNPTPNPHPTPIERARTNQQLLNSVDSEGETGEPPRHLSDADRWRNEIQMQPWAQSLKRALAKIGPENWTQWDAIVTRFGLDAVLDTCQAFGGDRWPDAIEKQIRRSDPIAGEQVEGIRL